MVGVTVLLLLGLVTTLTVDLGPAVRAKAEEAGSGALGRELRIGRLSMRVLRGDFVVEDLYVGGPTPTDRPFLEADRIVVSMSWLPLLRREVFVESFEMSGWRMLIETFPGGRHTLPTGGGNRGDSDSDPEAEPGQKRFVTTFRQIRALGGELVYEDHGTPWNTVARNLDIVVVKSPDYRGEASFSGGTVQIRTFEPMSAAMTASFDVDGPNVHFDRIDLLTDGARTQLVGDVDATRWPEQTYEFTSEVDFTRMREIFFARDRFTLSGVGEFTGTYHLFPGGYELTGRFASDLAGLDAQRFPDLRGSLRWQPDRLEVSEASSGYNGGRLRFSYSMAPLGQTYPATASFDVEYDEVDLAALTDHLALEGVRLAGRARGRNLLVWPLGHFAERRGDGHVTVQPQPGRPLQGAVSLDALRRQPRPSLEVGPFASTPSLGYLPVEGEIVYRFDPEWLELEPSRLASPRTYVEFQGRTAFGDRSDIPFHVTSSDWQESDRVLAGIMTAVGTPTRAVPIGGFGTFDGRLLDSLGSPRVVGQFHGERMRAWDVDWGTARADVTVENAYARITGGAISQVVPESGDASEIGIDGRFSIGFPRRDGGDEIDARIRLTRRPLVDLRHAFGLDEYRVTGLISGQYHLFGKYAGPFGFGSMTIEEAVAYGEPIETATGGLRFEGDGVRVDGIEMRKSTGTITGAAFVGWDGTYSFDANGRRLPVESIAAASYPDAPLSGLLEFSAAGTGEFDAPRYDVRGRVDDLFVRDEGVGQVTGRIGVRRDVVTLEVEVASPRLAVSGSGRIARTDEADAELAFRFVDSSLDPYVRMFQPRLSPFTTAVASGSIRVVGELRHLDHLTAEATVEQLELDLFDYQVRNDGPIRLTLDSSVVSVDRLRLTGVGTQLEMAGEIGLEDERLSATATGDASLGILQGFFRDLRSEGEAAVQADIGGRLSEPLFTGRATLKDGRIRHFSLPHSFEAINGTVSFDAGGVHLDDILARLGGGDVRLGGRIGLEGYVPGELSLTAVGSEMRLRYPEGMRSIVDADLALRGDLTDPILTGTVDVRSAVWSKQFTGTSSLFELAGVEEDQEPASVEPVFQLGLDVRILAPRTLRIENDTARIVSSADLTLRGTYDRPLLFGRADIDRGEVLFEGNRYFVTRGSIDFANPSKIEPFFDIEAETRVRVPGETYRVLFRATGTAERFVPDLTSDPPLPTVDILSLLFGDPRDPRDAELRALRSPQSTEQDLIRARAARLLASPISSGVGRVVEETFGVDSVQITPSLASPTAQQSARLSPAARLTIGKRISDRVYLTFSRALAASSADEVILVEYDQTDRLAWLVSQNEDRTYALDFRVRHSF